MKLNSFCCFFGVLLWCLTAAVISCSAASLDAVSFSLVPKKNVDQQITELSPLLTLLAKELDRPVKVVRPHSYQSVIEGILSKTIDFAILGPASYARARARDSRVEAFAAFARKKGIITPRGCYYHAVLIAMAGGDVKTADDLRQKTIAFTDPASTSGYLFPHVDFQKQVGRPLNEFFATQIYTGSHDRSIHAVVQGRVDGAFVSSARVDEAIAKGVITLDQVTVLWRSSPIFRDPFVFRAGLDRAIKEKIRATMLASPPVLREMFDNMHLDGIVAVKNSDYQAIHDIVVK